MAMQMQRAFNTKFLSTMTWYQTTAGSYNNDNDWVEGSVSTKNIVGRITTGNKFSQFEEGEALHSEDGGARWSNYRTLYVTDSYPIKKEDKIKFGNTFYNILQRSDESVFGFYSYLIEETEGWTP